MNAKVEVNDVTPSISPYVLEVFLHHVTSPTAFPRSQASGYLDVLEYLIDTDLLYLDEGGVHRATERGLVWLDTILSTPPPEIIEYWVNQDGKIIKRKA